jgi:hypothetical protein
MLTKEIPMCLCNKNETDLSETEIEYCAGVNLTLTEISNCEQMDALLLTDYIATEDLFSGNCTMNLEIYKFGAVDLAILCNNNTGGN